MKKVVYEFLIAPEVVSGIELHFTKHHSWLLEDFGMWVKDNAKSVSYHTSTHLDSMMTKVSIVADFDEDTSILYELKKPI